MALTATFEKLPLCIVGMEACLSAHFVSRTLREMGFGPRIIPAIYVKPFNKGQKNDYNDAEAIAEAALRPNLKTVSEKTQERLDLQALHRFRARLVSRRTAKERRKHPNIKKIDDGEVQIEATNMAMLRDLYGVKTSDAANGLIVSALDALGENGQRFRNFMSALPVELEPRDAIEAMLVVQMGATHVSMTTLTRRMLHAKAVMRGASTTFGTAFGTATAGTTTAFGTSILIGSSYTGDFVATLIGNRGSTLSCQLQYADSSGFTTAGGVGVCQHSDGRIIDIVW